MRSSFPFRTVILLLLGCSAAAAQEIPEISIIGPDRIDSVDVTGDGGLVVRMHTRYEGLGGRDEYMSFFSPDGDSEVYYISLNEFVSDRTVAPTEEELESQRQSASEILQRVVGSYTHAESYMGLTGSFEEHPTVGRSGEVLDQGNRDDPFFPVLEMVDLSIREETSGWTKRLGTFNHHSFGVREDYTEVLDLYYPGDDVSSLLGSESPRYLVLTFFLREFHSSDPGRTVAAILSGPFVAQFLNEAAFSLYERERFDEAAPIFASALFWNPLHFRAAYNAACASALEGDMRSARNFLLTLEAMDHPEARRRIHRVETDPDFAGFMTNPTEEWITFYEALKSRN